MKVSKVKLAFIVFLTTSIIWAYTFIITFQEYRSAMLGQPLWLTRPYYDWNIGGFVCLTGGFLIFAWAFFIPVAMGKLSVKEILETLEMVPLSLFHMDYQTQSQKENETKKRKVSKVKLAFIILSTATIIWAIMYFGTSWKYISLGIMLSAGWLGLVVLAIDEVSKRKKPTVNPLEARSPPSPE